MRWTPLAGRPRNSIRRPLPRAGRQLPARRADHRRRDPDTAPLDSSRHHRAV